MWVHFLQPLTLHGMTSHLWFLLMYVAVHNWYLGHSTFGQCKVILPQWKQIAHRVFRLILVKWSAWWHLLLNHMPHYVIEFRSSTLVSMLLTLAVLLSRLTSMVSMAVGDSSHLGDQTSLMLLDPALISACSGSMPPGCLLYHSISTLCTRRRCHV